MPNSNRDQGHWIIKSGKELIDIGAPGTNKNIEETSPTSNLSAQGSICLCFDYHQRAEPQVSNGANQKLSIFFIKILE